MLKKYTYLRYVEKRLEMPSTMSNRTKNMFAEKIQELAKNKQVKDIQIKELCEACGVERTTFYYHFCDKYELIAWIFKQAFIEEANVAATLNDENMIYKMLCRLDEKRKFFVNALQDDSQNNLRQYMLDFYIDYERRILCDYLKTDFLDEEIEYAICQYSYGGMGQTIDWLLGRKSITPKKLAYYQYKFMPDILKQAYKCYKTYN